MNLFDVLGADVSFKPIKAEVMPRETLLALVKEATGLYLSGHPMEEYTAFTEKSGFARAADIAAHRYPDSKRLTLAGIADGLKVRQLKNNSIMATAFLEDMSGSVGLTIFAAAYTQFRNLLISGEPVTVSGRVSEREDRDPELVVERVEKIPETAKGKASEKYKRGLYLKVKSLSGKEFEEIRRQLSLHGGSTEVIILCTDTGKKLAVPPSLRITPSETLFNALKSLLGAENVKFIK